MKIKKVFNQNAVLVVDGTTEKVAIGKGIGFNKKKNDLVFDYDIEQLFIMENEQENFQQLLSQIDESYFFASERIIEHAEHALKEKLNEHIHIALGDHIAFAMDRLKNGIVVRNKLRKEIEVLYAEEFLIAEWAIEYLS
ncbi:MAG: CAT RNA binding domain-containing protein, partial [Carnobacterium sp.]